MAFKTWTFNGLIGGGAALDGRITVNLEDEHLAQGYSSGAFFSFRYDVASQLSEQVATFPFVIKPDDNAGDGRWIQNDISAEKINLNQAQFDSSISAPSYSEGLIFYDSTHKTLSLFNDESEVLLQVGQELFIRVKNDSGVDIENGEVCYLSGVDSGLPTVAKANSSLASTCLATIGIATHKIEDGTTGYITNVGTVRDVDTTGFTTGDQLYLSDTVSGGLTKTLPGSPSYLIAVGQAVVISDSVGTIQVNIEIGTNTTSVIKIFNGAVLEDTATTVVSDGDDVTLSYQKSGGGDLSLFFNGTFDAFDSTDPIATIVLTPGTDTVPVLNYVYIPESTGVLTKSTVGFPATQHVPVATALIQSAASAQTDGVFKLHAWTDHLADSNEQGHLSHVNNWIRHQHATWLSGAVPSLDITVNGGAIDNVFFSNTLGSILQLHDHAFPALDMAVSDPVFVVNDITTAYDRITDLSSLDVDSLGATLRSNNTYYSLVIFGVASEAGADSKLFCNLPSGSYASSADAINDVSRYSNFDIPIDFKGTGFLIARVILRYQTSDSGTLTEVETKDLRGLQPSVSP